MEDHAKLTSRMDPDHIILQVGTKDLPTWKTAIKLQRSSCNYHQHLEPNHVSCDQYCKKVIEVN